MTKFIDFCHDILAYNIYPHIWYILVSIWTWESYHSQLYFVHIEEYMTIEINSLSPYHTIHMIDYRRLSRYPRLDASTNDYTHQTLFFRCWHRYNIDDLHTYLSHPKWWHPIYHLSYTYSTIWASHIGYTYLVMQCNILAIQTCHSFPHVDAPFLLINFIFLVLCKGYLPL